MLTKYHAIIFISILTMLVLLGLHLLGIASHVTNSQNSTTSASLARGSSTPQTATTSTNSNNNNDYTHPISFDRLASSGSIGSGNGAGFNGDRPSPGGEGLYSQQASKRRLNQPEYPIDHYQISQSTNQPLDNRIPPTQAQQVSTSGAANKFMPFGPIFGPPPPPLPPPPLPLQPVQGDPSASNQASSSQPSQQSPQASMAAPTTTTTNNQPQQQQSNTNQRQQQQQQQQQQQAQIVQSTFGSRFPLRPATTTSHTASPVQPTTRQPAVLDSDHYTPPILYGNNQYLNPHHQHNNNQDRLLINQQQFSDNNGLRDPRRDPASANSNNNIKNSNNIIYHNHHQQQPLMNNIHSSNINNRPQVVLSPQQQAAPLPISFFEQQEQLRQQHPPDARHLQQHQLNNQIDSRHPNFVSTDKRILPPPMQAPYKDANLARSLPPPPSLSNHINNPLSSSRKASGPHRYGNPIQQNNNRPGEPENGFTALPPYSLSATPLSDQQQLAEHNLNQQQQLSAIPLCARALGAAIITVTTNISNNHQVTLCQEDSDYPSKAVMGALELYGPQILEQIMPQTIVNSNHLSNLSPQRHQQQLQLDSLRPSPVSNIGSFTNQTRNGDVDSDGAVSLAHDLSPSANYDNLCKSKIGLVHPRRAKNLQGQWKIVVNFPNSEKFRGISLGQPVRIEECNQLNNECGGADKNLTSPIPKTRCLQQYGDHRLVAWSAQRGLHVDMFRLPVSCACHMRR